MTLVRFLKCNGDLDREVEAPEGANLLDIAQGAGQPLEGTCDKALSCATCHVIIAAEDYGRLPPMDEEEDDMLDFAWNVQPTSRLACQIRVEGDTLTVRMP
jgi:ferredoxin